MIQRATKLLKRAAMACVLWAAAGARGDLVSTTGSLFNPGDPAFAGATSSLSLSSGSITINTDDGTITGSISGAGLGDYFYRGVSQSGNVSLGVFVFDSINLPAGVSVNVTGSQGLVLASRHDLNLGTTLQVNGAAGESLSLLGSGHGVGSGGAGGAGAEGGSPSPIKFDSKSALIRGNGGAGGYGSGSNKPTAGVGRGGARPGSGSANPTGGAGGGYGGVGGKPTLSGNYVVGPSYGDSSGNIGLVELFGGSGGAGGFVSSSSIGSSALAGGGGGGGSIELIALGTLDLTGSIEAKGGAGGSVNRTSSSSSASVAGGGGSGGGIVLAANQIVLSGQIDARGGEGGSHSGSGSGSLQYYGGGGGGGRIAMYYDALSGATPTVGGNILINGGTAISGPSHAGMSGGYGSFSPGTAGSFPFQPVSTPELSSFCLAMIGAAPVLLRRRRYR